MLLLIEIEIDSKILWKSFPGESFRILYFTFLLKYKNVRSFIEELEETRAIRAMIAQKMFLFLKNLNFRLLNPAVTNLKKKNNNLAKTN